MGPRIWGRTMVVASIVASGCGSGNPVGPPPPPATETAQTGATLDEALDRFVAIDREGAWSRAQCREMAGTFEAGAAAEPEAQRRADAYYMAGMAEQRCGERERAASFYREAIRAHGAHCKARVGLGLALRAAGDAGSAERSFREAVRLDRACAEGWVNLAILERRRGELDPALASLRRALAADASYVEALHEMALVHLAEAHDDVHALDRAELVCRQAHAIDPSFAPLHNTWGVIDAQRGRVVEALSRFEHAFTLDPDLFEAWMNYGQIALSFRSYEDAERVFREALGVRERDYDALIGHGVALRGLGRLDEAERRYEAARRRDPERPEAWFNLAILHHEHRDGDVEELEVALDLYETFVDKADGDASYATQVSDVSRCCGPGSAREDACRPGRMQNVRAALRALGRRAPGC